jgi:hypothetical protein
MIRRVLIPLMLSAAVLVGFSGCEILEALFGDLFGGGEVDLRVQSIEVGDTGETLEIVFANDGDESASGVDFIIILSADKQRSPSDFEIYYGTGLSLGPSSTQVRTVNTGDLDLSGVSAGTYHIGAVIDPDDFVEETNEGNNAAFTPEAYDVDDSGGGGGSVPADAYEPNDAPGSATSIPVGGWVSATISPSGDQDWFYFYAEPGISYDIETFPASGGVAMDTVIELTDGSGYPLTYDTSFADDKPSSYYSLIAGFTVNTAQYVYIVVYEFDDMYLGHYELSVTGAPYDPFEPNDVVGDATYIEVSTSSQDHTLGASIAPAGDVDWFYFYAEPGTAYDIETFATGGVNYGGGGVDMDTVIELTDYLGNPLSYDGTYADDKLGSLYSLISGFTVASAQDVYIRVEGYGGTSVGDFELRVGTASGSLDVIVQ